MKRTALSTIVLLSLAKAAFADGTPALEVTPPALPEVQTDTTSTGATFTSANAFFRVSYKSGRMLMIDDIVAEELKLLNASGAKETISDDLSNGNTSAFTWTRTLPRSKGKVTRGLLVVRRFVTDSGMAIVTFYGSWDPKGAMATEEVFRRFIADTKVRF